MELFFPIVTFPPFAHILCLYPPALSGGSAAQGGPDISGRRALTKRRETSVYDGMIVFPSATAARRAERALAGVGIPAVLTRPPASATGGSCAHGLKLDRRGIPRARETLGSLGISWRSLWALDRDGWGRI